MRYLILSDIHANITALDTVLAASDGDWDKIVCLGDIVGYGPDPNEAIDRIRALGCVTIRGNHDKAIAGITEAEDFNPIARAAMLWSREQLTDKNLEFLKRLPHGPVFVDGFCIAHGSIRDEDEYVFVPQQALEEIQYATTPLTFFGHTHRQGGFTRHGKGLGMINFDPTPQNLVGSLPLEQGATYFLNPGSIGQPRDGDPRAGYAILDDEAQELTMIRVRYPVEEAQAKIHAAGLPPSLANRLALGR